MKKKNKVTQFHYNPEAVLKRFSSDTGALYRYSKSKNAFEPETGGTYKNYGSERNLYSEEFEITYSQHIDRNFVSARNNFEKYVSEVIEYTPTQEDFNSIAEFISHQPFRTPMSSSIFKSASLMFTDPMNPLTEDDVRLKFSTLIKQKSKEIISKMSDSQIHLLINNTDTPFIYSDIAVSTFTTKVNNFKVYTEAFLNPDSYFYFPLNSKLCLWVGDKNTHESHVEIKKYPIETDYIQFINAIIFKQANEYVYSSLKETVLSAKSYRFSPSSTRK